MTTEEKQAWLNGLQVGDLVCIGRTDSRTWRVARITPKQIHVEINERWSRAFRKSDGRQVEALDRYEGYSYLHSIEEVEENLRREYERLSPEGKKCWIRQNVVSQTQSLTLDELQQVAEFIGTLIASRAKTDGTDNERGS